MSGTGDAAWAIDPTGRSGGHCDCCGHDSHTVRGMILRGADTAGVYYLQWTAGHVDDTGASVDLILGV